MKAKILEQGEKIYFVGTFPHNFRSSINLGQFRLLPGLFRNSREGMRREEPIPTALAKKEKYQKLEDNFVHAYDPLPKVSLSPQNETKGRLDLGHERLSDYTKVDHG